LDYTFETFERFRNSLQLECSKETTAAVLTVTPNITWPDVVYYNRYVIQFDEKKYEIFSEILSNLFSYTHPYMGWRINIVDDFNQRFNYANGSGTSQITLLALFMSIIISLLIS